MNALQFWSNLHIDFHVILISLNSRFFKAEFRPGFQAIYILQGAHYNL